MARHLGDEIGPPVPLPQFAQLGYYLLIDYDRALQLAKTIAAEHPNDYYAHEYLGDIYLARGDLANAEAEYSRAYDLSPPQVMDAKLRDVRKRRGIEPAPAPTLSPWP